jgi:hypothetical protein
MLKTLDIILGLSVVMLMVSLVVTVLTQAVTNLLQTRGKNLLDGLTGLLRQVHRDLPEEVSEKIATAILTHPMIKSAGSRYGTIIHREELTILLLQLAADDGPHRLEAGLRSQLLAVLKDNGIDDPLQTLERVRSVALQLERVQPQLSNATRHSMALLQEANSRFLAKINGWFDQTIDRVSDRFTNSARIITFCGSLLVALVLQLDTAALVNRLAEDPAFRQALVEQAIKVNREAIPKVVSAPAQAAAGAPADATLIPALSDVDKENLRTLARYDVLDIPRGLGEWFGRWTAQNFVMKLLGILLTAMLLSLGAPFWYNALKNLIKLRSVLAQKDDDQRVSRQSDAPVVGSNTSVVVTTPAVIAGERGDLRA